ncbi:MAG TPA: hypothetical protein VMT52_03265, partial [Planctomycetota bacterium]|nr:hypothetical protein [Planctomycetota bacterium]
MKRPEPVRRLKKKEALRECRLASDRIALRFVPEFGCHWVGLKVSVKGEWLDFLSPFPDQETMIHRAPGYGSYLLAPWSNRIAGASFEFDGKRHALEPSFADGTAIHGDVGTRPWKVHVATPERFEASLDSRDFKDFNYPFAIVYRHVMELSSERLRVELALENVDEERAPVGMGFHPFVRRRLTSRDKDLLVVVPAEEVYPAEGCIPVAPAVPVSGPTDLRDLALLGPRHLDHCFTGFTAPDFRIIYPGTGVEVRYRVDPVFTHAVIYAPNDSDGRPRDFVAVEPVTHANDGFHLLARG